VLAGLARVLLVIALLAGWQAALEHPIEHVDSLGEFVHLQGGHSHDDGSEAGLLCDTLAALTACAPEAPALTGQHFSDYQVPSPPLGAPRVAQAPPFLAQGPPIASV
jgi:hypothetical protein